jgi:hypothetical protein
MTRRGTGELTVRTGRLGKRCPYCRFSSRGETGLLVIISLVKWGIGQRKIVLQTIRASRLLTGRWRSNSYLTFVNI